MPTDTEGQMKSIATVFVLVALLLAMSTPAWSAGAKPLNVNEVAGQPEKFLGNLSLVGRVSAVTPGKGFTLVDSGNCSDCGSHCPVPKKIPLVWRGSAPPVKSVVVVKGVLSKTAKGVSLVADNVTAQSR
jgi:hypothetical protein